MYQFPISTYRLQFNAKFTFQSALQIVKYLQSLGISHCYASPIFCSKQGSGHGYDVLDHSRLNPELGTQEEFESLVKALRQTHMGLLLDIVPNHMHAVDATNRWWADVLENGPSSPYASFFDIDWNPPRSELVNKVLLPLLEQQYGKALESQSLKVTYKQGSFYVEMPWIVLPTDPRSWTLILLDVLESAKEHYKESYDEISELKSIITALTHLPQTIETQEEMIEERQREKEVIKRRLDVLFCAGSALEKVLEQVLLSVNGVQNDPDSFDVLESFLNNQPYRLCYWRVANDEINYRRFFDIISLAGIRTEKPEVFEAVHRLVFDMIEKKQIDGVRVDHIDGLWNPRKYFEDFHNHCFGSDVKTENKEDLFYIIGEKILTGNEKIRSEWLFHGTTGYDFLNQLNGLYVMQSNRKAILDVYVHFTETNSKISEHIYASKKLILLASMSSELYVLSRHLDRISEQHRSSRDFTTESLRAALRDAIACFPVYRSYIESELSVIHKEDEEYIHMAINRAKRRNPATNSSIFDFIQSVLLLEHPSGLTEEMIAERAQFVMRFQQLTSPVMAKGTEDTAFYRFFPLASINDVGGDPYSFGISPETFHEKNVERHTSWPHAMLATSTHDTKRSEDVRARINVLSEIPEVWKETLARWSKLNEKFKGRESDDFVPDANEEYLFYQTLIGSWPLYPMDPASHVHYIGRIQAYMEKALKEAKINTSWINPNTGYDMKVKQFVHSVLELDTIANPFLADLKGFMPKIAAAGMLNSLSQLVIKMTSPGVPDLYQGNEVWDFSLVDPDNRRPVDFENRMYLLQSIQDGTKTHPIEFLEQILHTPEDGRIKLLVTTKLLQLRMKEHELFIKGTYIPIQPQGEKQNHVIAYAMKFENRAFIVITTRFYMSLIKEASLCIDPENWKDNVITLPNELEKMRFTDIFTSQQYTSTRFEAETVLELDKVLSRLPFTVLEAVVERKCDA